MKEYAIYPFEVVRITQAHNQGNHLAHNKPFIDVIDFPWDCTGEAGKQWMYFHNDFKITHVLTKVVTNTIIMESVNPLYIPYQEEPVKLVLSCCHLDDVIINQLKVGQIIKKGERVSLGKAGATAIHGHMTVGINLLKPYQTNANGKVCVVCKKGLTPEQAFYVDDSIKIIELQGYNFQKVPKIEYVGSPVEHNSKVDQIKVNADVLNARVTPSLESKSLGYIRKGFYNIEDVQVADGYSWYKVQGMWIAHNIGWTEVWLHEETKEEIEMNLIERILKAIENWLKSLLSK